jgi:phosphohistidine phosphatase
MKTLLIMRHAKSGGKGGAMPDYKRPLKKRGEHDAPQMGQLLKREGLVPSLILSSGATRALRTAELAADACSYTGEIQTTRHLYNADVEGILGYLQTVEDDHQRVMVIGHNPDLELLLETLVGRYHRLPTAALAYLTLPVDRWLDLNREINAQVHKVWRPKELDL